MRADISNRTRASTYGGNGGRVPIGRALALACGREANILSMEGQNPSTSTSRSMLAAMLCAGAVTGQFVTGKATRDALFLASLGFTALPAMLMATSVCSIVLVALNARGVRRISPATLVPASFVVSGALLLCEWLLTSTAPATAAVLVYLHISGAGPLLASGFWL